MTVQSNASIVYLEGDGANKIFNYSFVIIDTTHLEVSIDGVVQGSGYVVAGLAPTIGGTCTFTIAPADGAVVILRRVVPATQLIDYITGGAFPADSHEQGLDLRAMYDQQLQEEVDRCVQVPLELSETVSAVLPTPLANAGLAWNTTATGLTNTFASAVTLAQAASAAAALIDIVSVKDYGAVGDGITDDTAAIQAAIDTNAGTIYVPDGSYLTTAKLNLNNIGQTFVGQGRNTASILANFRGGPALEITVARVTVSDLAISTLSGGARRTASPLGKTPPDATVDGVSTDRGIKIIGSEMTHVHITNCDIVNQPSSGVYFAGSGTGFVMSSCSVTACGGHGIIVDDGTHNGAATNRAGLLTINNCVIQNCWGHGIALGVDGGFTVLRASVENCDVFNVALGDDGTNQPALLGNLGAAIAGRMKNCRVVDCAGDASLSPASTTCALTVASSGLVEINNFRVINTMTYGIQVQPSCDRIIGNNIFFESEPVNQGIRVQTGSTGCRFTGIASAEFTLVTDIIDADAEVTMVVDGRRAKTVNGSNQLFFEDGIEVHTIATAGVAEITGRVMDIVGEGDVADTIVTFRFDAGVDLPDGTTFTFVNLNAYNISIQDNDVSAGNIYMDTGTVAIVPDDAISFVVAGGKYFAINRGI